MAEKIKEDKKISLQDFLHSKQPLTRAEEYYYKGNFEDHTLKSTKEWSKITKL